MTFGLFVFFYFWCLAFGLGGNSLELYHIAAKVGVYQLTMMQLSEPAKLTLCSQLLNILAEALGLYEQVCVILLEEKLTH